MTNPDDLLHENEVMERCGRLFADRLPIGFGSVLRLEPEAAEAVLFAITMTASFYGFSSWLEGIGHLDIRKADPRDYRLGLGESSRRFQIPSHCAPVPISGDAR